MHQEPDRNWAKVVTARSLWFEKRYGGMEEVVTAMGKKLNLGLPDPRDPWGIPIFWLILLCFWSSVALYILIITNVITNRRLSIILASVHFVFTLLVVLLVQVLLAKKPINYNQARHTNRASLLQSITVLSFVAFNAAIAIIATNFIFFQYYRIDQFSEGLRRRLDIKKHNEAMALAEQEDIADHVRK